VESRSDYIEVKERMQRIMEYGLGVLVPLFLAMMMFSYVLLPEIFLIFMALSVLTALAMLIPAKKIHDLSFEGWSKHTLPRTIVVCLMGMIYITETSIFAVAMLSLYKGLTPENPLTFGVFGALVLSLIALLAYNDRYKDRYDRIDKRLYGLNHDQTNERIASVLKTKGHDYTVDRSGVSTRIDLKPHGLMISLKPVSSTSTEVLLEVIDGGNTSLAEDLKIGMEFS
jgi:hypothetical protein